MSKRTVTIEFPGDHEAMDFIMWLCNKGADEFLSYAAEHTWEHDEEFHPRAFDFEFFSDEPMTRPAFGWWCVDNLAPDWTIRTTLRDSEETP